MLCQCLERAICLQSNSPCRFSVHANVKEVDMSSRLYFAYGSNLDFNQMTARCPNVEYVGVATLGQIRRFGIIENAEYAIAG